MDLRHRDENSVRAVGPIHSVHRQLATVLPHPDLWPKRCPPVSAREEIHGTYDDIMRAS
jgi:hypothetical protein